MIRMLAGASHPKYQWNFDEDIKSVIGALNGVYTHVGTNRTRINPDTGLVESVGADTERIELVGGHNALLCEPVGANILVVNGGGASRDMTTGWTPTNITPVQDATGHDGTANKACTLTATAANGTIVSAVLNSSHTDHNYSLSLKRKTGTGSIYITVDNGGTWTEKTLTSSWLRFDVTKTASNPQVGIKIATDTNAIYADFHQVVTGKTASSVIDNDGVSLATMEDATTYNETDVPGKVAVYPTLVTLTDGDRDEDYYVTHDEGAGAITDFTHRVDVCVTELTDNDTSAFICWAISNANDDLCDIDEASGDCVFVMAKRSTATTHYNFDIYNVDGGVLTYSSNPTSNILVETPSYLSITRLGTTLTVEIYSTQALRDAGGSGDVETRILTVVNTAFRYAHYMGSYNYGAAGIDISGWVSNLTLTDGNIERVLDGGFDVVTDDQNEMSSGTLTIGNCYKISAQTDGDFTTVGAPDSNVGTYFNATATGAGLLDAGDKVYPVVFTHWTAGTGWAPEATAGALTGKAKKTAGTASNLTQSGTPATANEIYSLVHTAERSAGTCTPEFGSTNGAAISAAETYYDYPISSDTDYLKFKAGAAFAGTIDAVSIQEHGTVRQTESGEPHMTLPSSLFDGKGTLSIWAYAGFAHSDVSAGDYALISCADSGKSLLYLDENGNICTFDGTNETVHSVNWPVNTWRKYGLKWDASQNKVWVGADTGSGVSWTEGTFDEAYTEGSNLRFSHTPFGRIHLRKALLFRTTLTDTMFNHFGGSI